jgi:hypothetical protein
MCISIIIQYESVYLQKFVCFNFVYSSKILCGITQLDVRDVTHDFNEWGILRVFG